MFFSINYFLGFFIQSLKIVGLFNLQYLYTFSSFKFNLKVIDIFNLPFFLKKTKLLQTFNNITWVSDGFQKNIYPANFLNSYTRLKNFFNYNILLYNMFNLFFS